VNKGWFRKGDDPRRHPLTRADCRKGYVSATQVRKMPSRTRCWLRRKIGRFYQGQPRKAGAG
jgi:hypothetical protein